jgi:hypothetical protein
MLAINDLKAGMTKQSIIAIVTEVSKSTKFSRLVLEDDTGSISITCFKRHLVEKITVGDIVEITTITFSTWKSVLQGLMAPLSIISLLFSLSSESLPEINWSSIPETSTDRYNSY